MAFTQSFFVEVVHAARSWLYTYDVRQYETPHQQAEYMSRVSR